MEEFSGSSAKSIDFRLKPSEYRYMKRLGLWFILLYLSILALLTMLGAVQLPNLANSYAVSYPEFASLKIPWLVSSLLAIGGFLAMLASIAILAVAAYGKFTGIESLKIWGYISWWGPSIAAASLIAMAVSDIYVGAGPISIPVGLIFCSLAMFAVALLARSLFRLVERSFEMQFEIDQVV